MKKRVSKVGKKAGFDEVELVLPVPAPQASKTWVSNRVSIEVSDSAKAIYLSIKDKPNISRKELAAMTGISLKNTQKHLNKLKELGLIKRIGSTRSGYWEIVGQLF